MTIKERIPDSEISPNVPIGIYLPEQIRTNEEIESWGVNTPGGNSLTAESVLKRTGVE